MKRFSFAPLVRALALAALLFNACKTATNIGQAPAVTMPTATQPNPLPTGTGPAVLTTANPTEGSPAPTVTNVPAELPTRGPTVTAVAVATVPPAAQQAIDVPPGLEIFTHPEIPGFIFPADPDRWRQVSPTDNPWVFLSHTRIPECSISAVPGRGIGTPARVLRWQLGRLRWVILDDGNYALANIDRPAGLFLDLIGLDNLDCRADQQAVMEQVLLEDELTGKVAFDPLPTATARPPLAGFDCPNTPPVRLRPGDSAHIVTDDLWLRSAPEPTDETEMKTYDRTAPVVIDVLEGPVCGGKFVYWKVSIGLIGEGAPDPLTGWLAEGDLQEYYLEPGF